MGKASGVLYLVDGDAGGEKIKQKLTDAGISTQNIFTLKSGDSALEVEDFIDPGLILYSVNKLLSKFFPKVRLLLLKDLSSKRRMEDLERTYLERTGQKLPKVALAYEILEALAADPSRSPIDGRRAASLKSVGTSIEARFAKIALKREH